MIVVTTPTGAIGQQVLATLVEAGERVRVIARDPSRLAASVGGRIEIVEGTHDDPAVVDTAFTAAEAVLWVVPPSPRTDDIMAAYVDFTKPACDALVRRGVRRVVGISAVGRGTPMAGNAGLVTASLRKDDLIAGTGVSYRALIMPSFMDNMLHQIESIRAAGVFVSPIAGDRKLPHCATRDIAAAAARLLRDRSWSGQQDVPLLGREDLSFEEMAGIMSEVLAKPVRFESVDPASYKAGLVGHGISEAFAKGIVDMLVAKDQGLDNAEPRTPQSTTPTGFRQWCEAVLRPAVLG